MENPPCVTGEPLPPFEVCFDCDDDWPRPGPVSWCQTCQDFSIYRFSNVVQCVRCGHGMNRRFKFVSADRPNRARKRCFDWFEEHAREQAATGQEVLL